MTNVLAVSVLALLSSLQIFPGFQGRLEARLQQSDQVVAVATGDALHNQQAGLLAPLADVSALVVPLILPPQSAPDTDIIIDAAAAVVMDADSKKVLAAKDEHDERSIASITKLMTAIVALDSGLQPTAKVVVSEHAAATEGSSADLEAGEVYDFSSILNAMLIASGNDAAVALAERVAGSEEAFIKRMSDKAATLGMRHSNFATVNGLDAAGQYSSAFDVALMLSYAYRQYPQLAAATQQQEITIRSGNGNQHTLTSTNKLLGTMHVLAGKTGTTYAAGESLAVMVDKEGKGSVVIVVLDSPNRFVEVQRIAAEVFAAYSW